MSAEDELMERLVFIADTFGIDVNKARNKFIGVLYDYSIEKKKNELVVYEENKNEQYFMRFLMAKTASGRSKKTIYHYGRTLKYIFRQIQKDCDKVTSFDIQYYGSVSSI